MNTLLAAITALTVSTLPDGGKNNLVTFESDDAVVYLEATDGNAIYPGCTSKGRYSYDYLKLKSFRLGSGATLEEAKKNLGAVEAGFDSAGRLWTTGLSTPKTKDTQPKFTAVAGTAEEPVLSLVVNPVAGSELVIEGKENLDDPSWSPARKGHRFFRAVQK